MRVVPFEPQHRASLLDALTVVRERNPNYPPAGNQGDRDSLARWLDNDAPLERWVALVHGVPVGHAMLVDTHDYLANHLQRIQFAVPVTRTAELAKVFVQPGYRGYGVGASLIEHALQSARDLYRIPVLAVLTTSPEAIRLYAQLGLHNAGFFTGRDGVNWVFTG